MKTATIAALTLLLTLLPAQAQQAPQAFIAFVCMEQNHAEALAAEITEHNVQVADPRWLTCRPVGAGVDDMSDAPAPLMVLDDWEGDRFGLYPVQDAFVIVYWLNGYKPAGLAL